MQKSLLYLGTIIAFSLLIYALWAQHIGGFEPCVRCIYQRTSILVIALAGMLSLCHPMLRPVGLLIVFIAAIMGLLEAHTHVGVMAGTVNDFCPFRPDFGFLGRLDLTLPWFFEAMGDCADDSWQLLGFNMPEWMRFIFIAFALSSLALLIHWTIHMYKRKVRYLAK